jgi:hypothetical protein
MFDVGQGRAARCELVGGGRDGVRYGCDGGLGVARGYGDELQGLGGGDGDGPVYLVEEVVGVEPLVV